MALSFYCQVFTCFDVEADSNSFGFWGSGNTSRDARKPVFGATDQVRQDSD